MIYSKAETIEIIRRIKNKPEMRKECVIHELLGYIDDLEIAQAVHATVDIYKPDIAKPEEVE